MTQFINNEKFCAVNLLKSGTELFG
uniref:Uncharacterized protein n=1 Tax=Anguilla anguilla TaxID=7936 RepID=A0A0E9UX92_ANGAN